tara:strand:+ start:1492 stop:2481 length:990 start_codon:yes stop_codon:yes gene_type:complete
MAKITCAISGIKIILPEFSKLNVSSQGGYIHPIFAANKKQLLATYKLYAKGECSNKESYLLFLALLNLSGKVTWRVPVTLEWNSVRGQSYIANTINRLVASLEQTAIIEHPKFKQPRFVVNVDNSSLDNIHNWVRAWRDNIEEFKNKQASLTDHAKLMAVQNKLTYLVLSDKQAPQYVTLIADWAAMASNFPTDRVEEWKKAIRYCFNPKKIFNVDSTTLKEIKEHCETNLELDSLHYSEVMDCLKEGINNQINILGSSLLDLDAQLSMSMSTSSLEKAAAAKKSIEANDKLVNDVIASAPAEEPKQINYATKGEYLKAKIAYNLSKRS